MESHLMFFKKRSLYLFSLLVGSTIMLSGCQAISVDNDSSAAHFSLSEIEQKTPAILLDYSRNAHALKSTSTPNSLIHMIDDIREATYVTTIYKDNVFIITYDISSHIQLNSTSPKDNRTGKIIIALDDTLQLITAKEIVYNDNGEPRIIHRINV